MKVERIVLFGRDDETTRMVCHALAERVVVQAVVLEEKIPARVVFRRRMKRLGFVAACGQALFVIVLAPLIRLFSKSRMHEICATEGLSDAPLSGTHMVRVASINDKRVREYVNEQKPDAVVVNGTRLLSSKLLQSIDVPVINIHLGWNPAYRGGNGGYWALANGDPEHCGVTVHLIDEGVDTGGVLKRAKITPTSKDTFATYPLLQLSAGLQALGEVLEDGTLATIDTMGEPSAMWYHPTAWGYLWRRITKGVA
jgi:folate-dependent phosphoribosylglycinamide formyltransferase PurN